jgi:hypothetical protein
MLPRRGASNDSVPLMKLRIRLLSACWVVASGVALAAGVQWRAESATWTQPAGVTASASVESLVTPEYFGIQALKLWDFDGRTCSLQLEQSSFNAPSARSMDAIRFCEPKRTQAWKRADIGSGRFVTAISVCTAAPGTGQGAEIHGVELWGAAIEATGKLKPGAASVKLELARCEKWSPKRACPVGSVATGVRAHLAESEGGAVGLALRCHSIRTAD